MKTILIPLDGSPFGEHALPAALSIARLGEASLDLVHVHQLIATTPSPASPPFFDPDIDMRLREQEAAYLEEVAGRIAAVWGGPITRAVLSSPVADAICRRAQEIGAGLIVLSTHGRGGLARVWLGSVADRVIRQAKIPTLAIRPGHEAPDLARQPAFDHILIPLDGSHLAEQAIEMAEQLIGDAPARYDLLRAVEPVLRRFALDGADQSIDVEAQERAWRCAGEYLEQIAAPLRKRGRGRVVMTYVPIGHPAGVILERAQNEPVDLIAISTHGRGGVARMVMGSVADKVLRGSTAPVLVCRPAESADTAGV